jgi:hypothetical protein
LFNYTLWLGLGMACGLLIILWVPYEKCANVFHLNHPRLYNQYEKQDYDGHAGGSYFTVMSALAAISFQVFNAAVGNPAKNAGGGIIIFRSGPRGSTLNHTNHMLKNYFIIAFRNLLKNKVYAAINIIGLAIGMAACIVSALTLMVTCLGLLGLIAFITEQRQKEISIRKIMGAGLMKIIPLLAGNFILLVAISCLIAFPIAYLFMDKWLKIFPYNTDLGIAPFLLSASAVLLITLLTVMFHTVRAALVNPAESLKTE